MVNRIRSSLFFKLWLVMWCCNQTSNKYIYPLLQFISLFPTILSVSADVIKQSVEFPCSEIILKVSFTRERQTQLATSHSPWHRKTCKDSDMEHRFKGYCLPPVWIQGSPPHVVVFLKKIMSTSFIFFYLAPLSWLFFLPSFQVQLQHKDKV